MSRQSFLMASVAGLCFLAGTGFAASTPAAEIQGKQGSSTVSADGSGRLQAKKGGKAGTVRKPARAARTRPASVTSHHAENLVVLGAGASRSTQTISRAAIAQSTPGINPAKALSKLPGVYFASADPIGTDEWSQQITVRGFDQSRMGFTMDGIPLGNQNYGNDNGLTNERAVMTENSGPATINQGAGSISVAASNALGGALQFTSIDPSHKFGVDVAGTVGSAMTWRTFMRINSGDLPGGGRFYVAYDHQAADKWKGYGKAQQDQANVKYIQPFGEHVKLTLFGDWTKTLQNEYQDLSLGQIKKYGYNLDNISRNYGLAQQISSRNQATGGNATSYPGGYGSPYDVYYNGTGLREDALGYGKLDFDITSRLKASITGYGHYDSGQGGWPSPDVPSLTSIPSPGNSGIGAGSSSIGERTTEYSIHRAGFIGSLQYHVANHHIEGGLWFENNNFEQARRYYPLSSAGAPSLLHWFGGNPFATQWQGSYNTKTYQVHLGDVWDITRDLKLTYGFRSLIVDETARAMDGNLLGETRNSPTYLSPTDPSVRFGKSMIPSGRMTAANGFLPQIGVHYRINAHHEVFADYARNMAAYDNSGVSGPFSTTPAAFATVKQDLHPEMSNSEELGYRFHNKTIQASLTGYYVEFQNRLLVVPSSPVGITGSPNILQNVGGVTSRGVEAAFNWEFTRNWSLFASYAYNDSRYDDNVRTNAIFIPTKGRNVVGVPHNLANLQVGYDDGAIWGNAIMQFQDRRYFTYTNDQSVAPNAIFNLNVGYRVQSSDPWLRGLDFQVNVANLFNKRYVSTVGTNGFTASGDNQTLQVGAPRMVFFTVRKHFQ